MKFKSQHPVFEHLHKKWTAKHQEAVNDFLAHHGHSFRYLALGGLSSLIMLTTPAAFSYLPNNPGSSNNQSIMAAEDKNLLLAEKLKTLIPPENRSLTQSEEDQISKILSGSFGFTVTPQISGIRLNTSYGLIGGEQHLYRYPGDTLFKHADNTTDWAMYGGSGIAPHLGAWGYFAPSEKTFTDEDKMREKYYIAVQTFLAPGFAENVARYRDFFKYRKMLVANPSSGQAVVADIADAGPGESTGKQLGGSPEIMQALGLASGPRKGEVLYFFIDDKNNTIPLGPINVKPDLN